MYGKGEAFFWKTRVLLYTNYIFEAIGRNKRLLPKSVQISLNLLLVSFSIALTLVTLKQMWPSVIISTRGGRYPILHKRNK